MLEGRLKGVPPDTPVEIWFQDEARVGQKNGQVYQWAAKGTRPRQTADQRYENAYIFGAVCPAHDKGAALVMPRANAEAMQKHLEEISQSIGTIANGASEISEELVEVVNGTRETTEAVAVVKTEVMRLSQVAVGLQCLVDQFTLAELSSPQADATHDLVDPSPFNSKAA